MPSQHTWNSVKLQHCIRFHSRATMCIVFEAEPSYLCVFPWRRLTCLRVCMCSYWRRIQQALRRAGQTRTGDRDMSHVLINVNEHAGTTPEELALQHRYCRVPYKASPVLFLPAATLPTDSYPLFSSSINLHPLRPLLFAMEITTLHSLPL